MNNEFAIKRLEQVRNVFAFCHFSNITFSDAYQVAGNIFSETTIVPYKIKIVIF